MTAMQTLLAKHLLCSLYQEFNYVDAKKTRIKIKIKNDQFCRLHTKSSHLLTPIKDIHCCPINRYGQIRHASTALQPAKKLFWFFSSGVDSDWHSDYCREWLRWKVDRHCICTCYTCEIICSCSRRGRGEGKIWSDIKLVPNAFLSRVWYPIAVEI